MTLLKHLKINSDFIFKDNLKKFNIKSKYNQKRYNKCWDSPSPSPSPRKGINFLEWSGRVIPQGPVVSVVKNSWRNIWLLMMQELAPQSSEGSFMRSKSKFNNNIGSIEFPIEKNRYHVYIGNACPWCHRILLSIFILGLSDVISYSFVKDDPEKASRGGWIFESPDPITNCSDLREVYDKCYDKNGNSYSGRCTAPLLIDKVKLKIVSNESSKMLRNLNSIKNENSTNIDLVPMNLKSEIDDLNKKIYENVNNGVYKCGFSTSQKGYDEAILNLFKTLDELNMILSQSRFLLGSKFTEADLILYPTIIRFDSIYSTIFKCSQKRIKEYEYLDKWMRDIYRIEIPNNNQNEQIKYSIDLNDARRSYSELFPLNPSGIIPCAPPLESLFDTMPNRGSYDLKDLFYFKN